MDNLKTPMPPQPPIKWLRKDAKFWAQLVSVLDQKDQWITNNKGYATIGVEIKYFNGKIVDIHWKEDISDKLLIETVSETEDRKNTE